MDVVPYYLHVALLLIGLDFEGVVEYQGDTTIPRGDFLDIYVNWEYNNINTTVRIEDCIWDNKPMQLDEIQEAGYKSVEWNSTNNAGIIIPSGIYFYRIVATSIIEPNKRFIEVKKMMMIK